MRIVLIICLLFSLAVSAAEIDDIDTISAQIEQALEIGDNKQQVENFISKTGWLYTYDDYSNRYQARPKDDTAKCKGRNFLLWLLYDCGIQIYLNFDQSGSYSGFSVEQTYSGL
ncbi:hypothetical protein FJD32_001930 [Shewanella sp. LC6]|uniref:hypothetical protein n=1 Tax=unclassified Shewanella TaxID=196818 RepID=UPI001126649E|nr:MULTISPECIES: hypothetical protein [unclassified Shewanella]QQK58366.1 hypothetical protein FJD32_001930 [Shewanella sp. LC6]TPE65201.1 hypothetical protein FJD33_01410 [Shewanella sp. LC2]